MPVSTSFPFRTAAIKVEQPFGMFFIASIPAEVLLTVTYPDPLRIRKASDKAGSYPLTGTQRADSVRRLSEIGRFIDSVEAVFPTPIILAANYRLDDGEIEEGLNRWKLLRREDGLYDIEIPSPEKLASIVDGQHRLLAFERATLGERRGMDLACSIFFDLPNPYQAYLFATVNFNQKRVDRSLAFELYGFDTEDEKPEVWTPDKLAVFLCRKLNTDVASPLHKNIIVSAKDDELLFGASKPPAWRVSTATVVEGILKLFAKAPKTDRATMFSKTIDQGRNRQILGDDGTPLRQLFLSTNDRAIYEFVKNYFTAVQELFWRDTQGSSYVKKTVGIQAFFDVLKSLAEVAIAKRDISVDYFKERLRPASHINFADHIFQASGGGRVRIRTTLMLAMKLMNEADVNNQDLLPDYRRLIGKPSATP